MRTRPSASHRIRRFRLAFALTLCPLLFDLLAAPSVAAPAEPLFDGKTFHGWEGNTNGVWRIENGVIVGGSLQGNPRNEFLATTNGYRNFRLRLEYRLVADRFIVRVENKA